MRKLIDVATETVFGGQWGGAPPAPEKYVDLSYYQRAVAALER